MNRNVQNNDSSLLLQLPKSVLSFSDMSGNSFLMPVAVENAAELEKSISENFNPEEQEVSTKVVEPSICQLQQPLLMRRETSPAPNASVPYSESNVQTNNESFQREMSHSRSPVGSGSGISNQSTDTIRRSSSSGLLVQPSSMSSSFQNHPPTMYSQSNQSTSMSKPVDKENMNAGHLNSYLPPESPIPSNSNYPSNAPGLSQVYSVFSENNNEQRSITSTAEYFSQPPVITPSNIPAYYNTSGRTLPQTPQSSIPNMPFLAYSQVYEPVKPYWLFKDIVEKREVWHGFSKKDSEALEMAFQAEPQVNVVQVDGGRYDAILNEREKKPVYYEGDGLQIRRCTWYFLHETSRFVPFSEESSALIEEFFRNCVSSRQWQKVLNLTQGLGSIVFEAPDLIVYYKNEVEVWTPSLSSSPEHKGSPRAVKRGLPDNFEIMLTEEAPIDHLVFVVQGIGSVCDLRFRTVAECVDGLRDLSYKLLASHFRSEVDNKVVGRVEFLPLAWHAKLHTSEKNFDRCMQDITLPSIPKLRYFTNDTLLDILLYSSPLYCQTILDAVASDLNKLYKLFLKRNPEFSGKVFVAGHSLGSLILFDILSHQKLGDSQNISSDEVTEDNDPKCVTEEDVSDLYGSIESLLQACELESYTELFKERNIDLFSVVFVSNEILMDMGMSDEQSKRLLNAIHSGNKVKVSSEDAEFLISTPILDKTVQEGEKLDQTLSDFGSIVFPYKISPCMASIRYPRLKFEPAALFALGSPISMFMTVRGYDQISDDFRFPTCPGFFHIFHPYDPVAYRVEPMIDRNFSAKPVLIPHHKGRKRMHLEIRENLSKVGFEIKQKVLETLRSTWNSLSGFARSHAFSSAAVEAEVDKLVSEQMSEAQYDPPAASEISGEELQIGSLNGGRRIDYVLQEKPIEALNDYIFALTSHSTYWNSEDTVLMILREIYATQGILVSSQSVLDQREIIPAGHSSYESYAQMNPGMSSSYFPETSAVGQRPSVPAFYSPIVPPPMPGSTQSMQTLSNYPITSAPQVSSTIPGPLQSMQSLSNCPSMNVPQHSSNFPGPSQSMQSLGNYPTTSAPQVASNVPQPPTTQQQVGPPPLSGFVKRSPFTK